MSLAAASRVSVCCCWFLNGVIPAQEGFTHGVHARHPVLLHVLLGLANFYSPCTLCFFMVYWGFANSYSPSDTYVRAQYQWRRGTCFVRVSVGSLMVQYLVCLLPFACRQLLGGERCQARLGVPRQLGLQLLLHLHVPLIGCQLQC